ncbi:tRNA (adenosine(37)-N6)-threonylcarbamoyltransferase complex ATPase subunit type 1 TsaE [bacterium endosymbiont of Bathymodiolus sp. 5 South]|jgi:tRNA threonylcarbamoyladenosine biosynthesis protein TsaE|uniref:tRNA (adenosine(37)-N6)-threonylcarbamoyltransferase complex ATPase subunit type 1 TsaE n=1 Tax=bacterium endosymbiont of Bathymodiolus sp. 5 South TaxID=1181670 RepID=UPI0010AF28E3|nr:tRNA (adenosine(37)-N6)-threonylcarbamoyltransferase complex ATPase subunit type 1 TsaE [bacterium endosymbiont of Bathymodiolus sp. 5 South]CAC9632833.1 tRNA threonylcarbamoyladenosine biosynthesis protein TsaE [uncultured Gammaproteobacteria bacterium]SHN89244.1 TsaE protein, required for threonylcarbamoyladenosine t(6)A37 formation in tRNA [bacterium endosymbiont of Bathymodiolus sp. 5 South]SSC06869.1 TsaE protein, required for threonylcarbamoyladenosine t(6)A37 formation in tRNA [bacteri
MNLVFHSELEVAKFAQDLARNVENLNHAIVIYLEGDLGVGKTTIARNFIQTFGFKRVKSPTYSLVESYQNQTINIHHFDCYRLSDPEELEYIGIREYSQDKSIQLIEWAELGKGMIAPADLIIHITGEDNSRTLTMSAQSDTGKQLLRSID